VFDWDRCSETRGIPPLFVSQSGFSADPGRFFP